MLKSVLFQPLARVSCAALLLLSLPSHATEPLKLIVPQIGKTPRVQVDYFYRLLDLVMRKTESTDGPFTIETCPGEMSSERSVQEVRKGKSINLIWMVTNAKREQDLLPVRMSLLRELNNYRIFLIRKEDQPRFDKISTIDELRKLNAGLGSQWPDVDIMRNNDFAVTNTLSYSSLFLMLAAKRFDYFPRGLYEVFNEEQSHRDMGLAIEKNLMLYYDAPFYFFVSRDNPALADRIERGLKKAQADGSFDQLLLSVPGFARALEEQHNPRRKLFTLDKSAQVPVRAGMGAH